MVVANLQTWADNLETIRLPAIESDIANLQTRMTTEEAALVTKTTEINNTLTLHSARIDEAQVDADAAMAQANTSISNNIQLWTDAEIAWQTDIQNLRDEFNAAISQASIDLTAAWNVDISNEVNTTSIELTSSYDTKIAQVEAIRSDINTIKANIDIDVDTLNNVVLPAMTADIDALTLQSNTLSTDLTSLSSSLQTLYYTATDTNSAIAGAVTQVKSDIEDPNGTSLGATLNTSYRTAVDQDSATAASLTSLQSDIENPAGTSLGATLSNDYLTAVSTTQAISDAETSLQSNIDGVQATADSALTTAVKLDGYTSSTYVMRLKAGGAAGEVEMVAADDPVSGPSSVFRVAADDIIFDGAVNIIGSLNITSGAVETVKIANNAVTDFGASEATIPGNMTAIAFCQNGSDIWCTLVCYYTYSGSDPDAYASGTFKLRLNGTVRREISVTHYPGTTGTRSVILSWHGISGGSSNHDISMDFSTSGFRNGQINHVLSIGTLFTRAK